MKTVLCIAIIGCCMAMTLASSAGFSKCCHKLGIQPPCSDYCTYHHEPHEGSLTKKIVEAFHKGICNFTKDGPPFQRCFNNEKNNRKCCEDQGITGDCLDLCDGSKNHPFNQKYLACKKDGAIILHCAKSSH